MKRAPLAERSLFHCTIKTQSLAYAQLFGFQRFTLQQLGKERGDDQHDDACDEHGDSLV